MSLESDKTHTTKVVAFPITSLLMIFLSMLLAATVSILGATL